LGERENVLTYFAIPKDLISSGEAAGGLGADDPLIAAVLATQAHEGAP
jgi:hypothetical protein